MNPHQMICYSNFTTMPSSIGAIAAGQVGPAASFIERAIGGSIPIVLTFLGKVIGMSNFGGRIRTTVNRLKARLDGVIDKIIARVKGVIGAGKTAGVAVDSKGPKKAAEKTGKPETIPALKGIISPVEQFAVGREKVFD